MGTYLEHTRILCFGRKNLERLYIGSGDFLNRNLNRRVEVYTPILSEACKRDVLHLVETLRADTAKAKEMLPDGSYSPRYAHEPPMDSQLRLRQYYVQQNTKTAPVGFWQRVFPWLKKH